MKKLISLAVIFIFFVHFLHAQDFIVLKTGEEIKSKVLEITQTEIKYKKFENPDGPTIAIAKTTVFMIRYQNGTKDVINAADSKPQTENTSPGRTLNSNPFRIGFYTDPLGFVEFGPFVGTEMTIGQKLIIDAHARFSSLGLLMHLMATDDDEGAADKLVGLGIGGGLKYLAPSRIGGFYAGALGEYGWQTETYADDETWAWNSDTKYIVIAATAGYKFRFTSGLYIDTGAVLGAGIETSSNWHYLKKYNNDSSIHISDNETHPIGMLQICIGVEF